MTGDDTEITERTGLPDGWPVMYSAAGESPSCPHQMHWDGADELYRCVYECGKTAERPPDNKIEN